MTDGAAEAISDLLHEIDQHLAAFDHAGIREVQNGIARWSGGPHAPVVPRRLPPCDLLPEALATLGNTSLARAITAALPHLCWVTYDAYPRDEIGAAFFRWSCFCIPYWRRHLSPGGRLRSWLVHHCSQHALSRPSSQGPGAISAAYRATRLALSFLTRASTNNPPINRYGTSHGLPTPP